VWQKDKRVKSTWDCDYHCVLSFPKDSAKEVFFGAIGPLDRGPGQQFQLRFRGRMVKVGDFGHRGVCKYVVEVLEFLSPIVEIKA
jgi:hypothetical protein